MRYPKYIEEDYSFPSFYHVCQTVKNRTLKQADKVLENLLLHRLSREDICPGDKVGIGVGSRGINRISELVRIICRCLKTHGAKPFIIPAMGSHGNADASGQVSILEKLGITEAFCGAPVISSMEVVQLGEVLGEVEVFFSMDALSMDHTICINRIKPHTKFRGPLGSGILKMLTVGLGKHHGAMSYHSMALKYGFDKTLLAMGQNLLKTSNFKFGVGLVEDAYDRIMDIGILEGPSLIKEEAAMFKTAEASLAGLPVQTLDVLIIGQAGKEISGAGMDPNITGRTSDFMEDDFSDKLNATRIAVLNLSAQTSGNGLGIGNADIITEKVFQDLNYETTLMNALTSVSLRKAFIPVRLPTDEKAIQTAFTTIGPVSPNQIRAVIIRDTRHTKEFWASQALISELKTIPGIQIMEMTPLVFDKKGELIAPILT